MRYAFVFLLGGALLLSACESKLPDEEITVVSDDAIFEAEQTDEDDGLVFSEEIEPVDEVDEVESVEETLSPQDSLLMQVGGDRVFFGFDKYDLSEQAQETLDLLQSWLESNPDVQLTLEGHCDERGSREYNLALGERRAVSVYNYLIAGGVDPARLTTVSYGKEQPSALGSTEEAWRLNRRTVFQID